ncbi:transposase [Nocardia wallacei]|uniref:transposase n=1 Tax=Nocardia wallacei TaxID=480035 RepID=UPI003CC7E560
MSLTGPDGLLKQFSKTVLETALNEEMTDHRGYDKHEAPEERETVNVRNGTRPRWLVSNGPIWAVRPPGRCGIDG